jgi:hypothetical protein
MTGSGFAVLLAESLVSSDVFSPAMPAPYAATAFAATSGGSASGFDASAPRAIDIEAPASIAAVTRDKSYVLAQGALGMRPAGSVSAPLSSFSSEATQHDRFVAAIAPRTSADVGASAQYLWDAVTVIQQTLAAAAALQIAFPLSSAANASGFLSLLEAVAAQPSFEGASGNLDFICAGAPTVSPLAKIMHEDEKYVTEFAPLDWSKAPFAPAVYLSTLQRLVTGAATLWNAKGAAFVPVAAFTSDSLTAVQTHAIMWPGALREPPAGVIVPIAIWTQLSVSDGFSGLLASLLAIDLINSMAYSATAPAVLGASTAYVISHTGVSQPTVRAPIPASLLPLLPPLPPGVLLESSSDGLRPNDLCSPNAAASLACLTTASIFGCSSSLSL